MIMRCGFLRRYGERVCDGHIHRGLSLRGGSATALGYGPPSSRQHQNTRTLHSYSAMNDARRGGAFPCNNNSLLVRFHQQKRNIFIQTEETPNPASLKFYPGCQVLPSEYGSSMDFRSLSQAGHSPLARALLKVKGVEGVFLGSDFITISKSGDLTWAQLKPEVFAMIMDFFSEGKPAVTGTGEDSADAAASANEDDEISSLIKDLLEEQIRPMVQEDGGDIFFQSFDPETGVVTVKLAGSCAGCPSSIVTLKNGVENMLMYYIPEVTRVDEVMYDPDSEARKLSFKPSEE